MEDIDLLYKILQRSVVIIAVLALSPNRLELWDLKINLMPLKRVCQLWESLYDMSEGLHIWDDRKNMRTSLLVYCDSAETEFSL